MKSTFILLFAIIMTVSVFADTVPYEFTTPQFIQSFYDHYSLNYLNAVAAGRGHTGAGLEGNIENSLQNPAAFTTNNSQFYLEIFLKPPITEMNQEMEQNYESLVPFGILAYGYKPSEKLCLGVSYSTPQTIEYNMLSIMLQTGDYYFMYPSFNLHRVTFTGNYAWNDFRLGLNVMNDLYRFKDITTWGTNIFDRVNETDYVLRFQPGMFYKTGRFSAGASYMPAAKHTFDSRYQKYDATLPTQVNTGIGYNVRATRIAADMDLVRCSEMSDEFKDRYTLKAGVETDYHKYTLRAGFMNVPQVWKGEYMLPTYIADPNLYIYDDVPQFGTIKPCAQSMITGGFTWHANYIDFTLSFIQDVQQNVNYTEVFGSMGVNISKFNFKNLFPGDKKEETPPEDDTEIEYLD